VQAALELRPDVILMDGAPLAFGLLPEVITAQALMLERRGMDGAGALLELTGLRKEWLCPGGVAGLLQVLPHVV